MRGNSSKLGNELGQIQQLFNDGRFTQCEVRARNLLKSSPNISHGWRFLGLALMRQKRFTEALVPLQKAARLLPDDVAIKSYLGNVFTELERLPEAEDAYLTALNIEPRNADVLNNLGTVLRSLGKLQEAKKVCRKAIDCQPDSPQAFNNLGNVLVDSGEIAESIECYLKAVTFAPKNAQFMLNLGDAYRYNQDLQDEARCYQAVLPLNPGLGLVASVWLAIRHYQSGNLNATTNALLASKPIMSTTEHHMEPYRIYWNYLAMLLTWQAKARSLPQQLPVTTPLYVIGESHSLATHGSVVSHLGQPKQCTALWIAGCKQAHFGPNKKNKYTQALTRVTEKLPAGATVLLLIGEIDCRLNEGILRYLAKRPHLTLEEVVDSTIDNFLAHLSGMPKQFHWIVGGVPATNIPTNLLNEIETNALTTLLQVFNSALRRKVLGKNWEFLDLFGLTNSGNGFASPGHHIDRYHLFPSAISTAFANNLHRPEQ